MIVAKNVELQFAASLGVIIVLASVVLALAVSEVLGENARIGGLH